MNVGSIAIELQGVEYFLSRLVGVFSSPRLDGDNVYAISIKVVNSEDILVARRIFDL